MKKKILTLVFSLNILNLAGCFSNVPGNNNSGYLMASVRFPEKKFSVKFIPDSTSVIIVQVEGDGLTSGNPISVYLTKDNSSRVINNVPQGNKTVKAFALDIDGKRLAEGQNTVNVIAQKLNKVELELKLIDRPTTIETPSPQPSPLVSPSPVTSPSPVIEKCIVRIVKEDLPLSPSLEKSIKEAGCDIELPEQPTPTPSDIVSPTPSATSATSSGGGGGTVPTSNQDIGLNVNVHDASPLPSGIGFETPTPTPTVGI